MTVAAVEVSCLEKRFGDFKALDQVSFKVEKGEFFGLLGPNGAGKSTLIGILSGLVKASAGSAAVMGFDIKRDYALARKSLGLVPQELVFDPFFTVRETLSFQSGYFGIKNNKAWIDELLEALNLSEKAHTNMRALSGGMKRRVLVAQALVHRPDVVILDEPTAGVDVELRQNLWQLMTSLNQRGTTILLTTHYLEEAEAYCQRVAILNRGRILSLAKTQDLLDQFSGLFLDVSFVGCLPLDLHQATHELLTGDGSMSRVRFSLHHPSEVEQLLTKLRLGGTELMSIDIRRANLEDVFLRITKDN
jgi:ABC-2 type transport system ATP-binding protein